MSLNWSVFVMCLSRSGTIVGMDADDADVATTAVDRFLFSLSYIEWGRWGICRYEKISLTLHT